jgi:Glycosyl transferases group 1
VSGTRLLVVLSSDPTGPVVRYRWRAFAPALLEAGIVLEVASWPKEAGGRRRALHRAEVADGVVVSSRLLRVSDTRRLRRRARRLAFDFDDALPLRDTADGAKPSFTRVRRFRALVRASDAVFAGNAVLADLAVQHGARPVVLPTVVETPTGPIPPEPPPVPPVIGWIGSRATLPYLEERLVVLSALVASGRPFRLRVVADARPVFPPGIAVDHVPWTPDGWHDALAAIHLGFAPLPDDPWTRGKCGLKVLQMMSLGRPVVASAVGVQTEQVRHGETGFLATDRESMFDGLLTLVDDPERRRRVGAAAREDVRAHWCVAAWAGRVRETVAAWLDARVEAPAP